ncbi:MAG: hypothetical protein V1662_00700 [Candidatus Omnitrophota bacterium]
MPDIVRHNKILGHIFRVILGICTELAMALFMVLAVFAVSWLVAG